MSAALSALALGASGLAATAIGVGVLGTAATVYGANKAASATSDASNAAIQQQQAALAQQERLATPYMQFGQKGMDSLSALLGLTPGSDAQSRQNALASTPGYQFAMQQGLQNTTAAANAQGMGLSGNTLAALDRYSTGLASQTYQNQVGNLQNVVGTGQAAAAGQAANIGNSANNISNSLINQGTNLANINMNEMAGISKSLGGAANSYMLNQTLAGLNNQGSSVNPYQGGSGTGIGDPINPVIGA